MKDTRDINTSNWPEQANLTEWGRLLNLSYFTMMKYRREGKRKQMIYLWNLG